MRALLVGCVLAFASGPAADARVIMRPSVSRECEFAPTWGKMRACLAKFGKASILRTQGGAKLVQLSADDRLGTGWRVPGVYLFVEVRGNWRLGGMLEGDELHVTSFAAMTAGRFRGYRFDVSLARSFDFTIAQRQRRVVHRQTLSTFCAGTTAFCTTVTTSCDVYVDGKSYWMFRGTLEVEDRVAKIRGDRSASGDLCAQDPEVLLHIPVEADVQ